MTFKRIIAPLSAFILAAASIFAGNKKPDTTIFTIYYTVAGGCHFFVVTFPSVFFTTGGQGIQSTIKTIGGDHRKLWGQCTSGVPSHPVHAHF